jgi:ubiquinone/menaquinone biosynthesis C-methylase UbiE
MNDNSPSETIFQSQIEYYRARATEYDEWFYRINRYDHGEQENQAWFDDVEVVSKALHTLPKVDHVLELACGTGIWTQELTQRANHVTAIDASPEMININRAKVNSPQVEYLQADLFAWEPQTQYDLIFFGFWLSHVPPAQVVPFLEKVQRALKPNGVVFMVDSQSASQTSTAKDTNPQADDAHILTRTLNDGRKFQIVKAYHSATELEGYFKGAGLKAQAHNTSNYFVYVQATK